jgi:hypothetical protein
LNVAAIIYDFDEFQRLLGDAYAQADAMRSVHPIGATDAPPRAADPTLPPEPGLGIFGFAQHGVSARQLFDTATEGTWHHNAVRLVAHYVAKGWRDWEIMLLCDHLTRPGYTVDDTRREVAKAIQGARSKWNIPNPADEFISEAPARPFAATRFAAFDARTLPRREWIIGHLALRGFVSSFIAPPGAGKSTLTIEMAASVVTGDELLGVPVHAQGNVWLYNAEDDGEELRRRIAAVCQRFGVAQDALAGRLFVDSGTERPLMVAKRVGQALVAAPDVDAVINEIKQNQILLLVVDPLIETHEADENNNPEMRVVMAQYRQIAQRTKCGVVVVHHTRKPAGGDASGHAGSLDSARGASALQGVVRSSFTLFGMSDEDAKRYAVEERDRRLYVRLDDAKNNLALIDGDARWFRREGVTLPNGEAVGVLVPVPLAPYKTDMATAHKIMAELKRAFDAGEGYGMSNRGRGTRWAGHMMLDDFGVPAQEAQALIDGWLKNGYVVAEVVDTRSGKRALRVVRMLPRYVPDSADRSGN